MKKLILKWLNINQGTLLIDPPRQRVLFTLLVFYVILFFLITFSIHIFLLVILIPLYFSWFLYYSYFMKLWKMCGYSLIILNIITFIFVAASLFLSRILRNFLMELFF